MIHLILQFTLHIAFRGVLHRCANQEMFVQNHLVDVGEKKLCVVETTTCTTIRGFCFFEFVNVIDPSAGSPTETLLRLLLPRNVQI